jgi:complement component 1 Q subcomponent-binding protein
VQEEFEKFMQERGVNESLALFIPEYAEYKEQQVGPCDLIAPGRLKQWVLVLLQEYVKWLNNVKSFIDL